MSRSRYLSPHYRDIESLVNAQQHLNDIEIEKLARSLTNPHFISNAVKRLYIGAKTVIILAILYLANKLKPRYINQSKNIIMVDWFLLPMMIKNQSKIEDRYYNFFEGFHDDYDHRIIYIANLSAIRFKDLPKILRHIKNPRTPFTVIYKEQFLSISDYFKAFMFLFFEVRFCKSQHIPNSTWKYCISEAASFDTWNALLAQKAYYNIFSDHRDRIDLIIDWFENQPIDRSLMIAAKTLKITKKVIGYHGGATVYGRDFHFAPSFEEVKAQLCPRRYAAIGKYFKDNLQNICPYLQVSIIPAYRFHYLWEDNLPITSERKEVEYILVLPYYIEESRLILEQAKESNILSLTNIAIKAHPLTADILQRQYPEYRFTDISPTTILNQDLYIVFGTLRTTLMFECLSKGVPVILLDNSLDNLEVAIQCENCFTVRHRKSLEGALEVAHNYQTLRKSFRKNNEDMAHFFHKPLQIKSVIEVQLGSD
ncbi:hypothetical protein [Pseudobacteriovorax antillogorgiicola]|uniref:Uncharacterized protein n=1 Tax=Pseudobacteriovorax antillogorgiicola TaxID=1513793 RepID=A0A1Y6CSS7_9BACT|nr:hypothetical protein [Pseudobacteriovorax antillogorgiicola]TCS45216.1 hypothetical protein EDD56_12950 [Pseudobacteriovorax antillogorgiicola]SMF75450.1 hypothetical protein SAMN06296036_12930 [Pseudobacteriovorax antillogorgiicola]